VLRPQVLALTSRIPTLAAKTQQTLRQFAIDFNVNAPLPA
jgi:hypothetical protein